MQVKRNKLYWILGALVALAGVGVARVIAPSLPEAYQSVGFMVGLTIAICGIFIAALGAGVNAPPSSHVDKDSSQNQG